jgi:SAM-dependent methyltransferase
LRPGSRVLDIGTGGGEQFLRLVPLIGAGTGIDASTEMVAAARVRHARRTLRARSPSRSWMPGGSSFPAPSFDLVLNRHAPVYAAEIVRVLRPGGVFITQQVDRRNTQSIFSAFGWQSNAALWETTTQPLTRLPCQTKCMAWRPWRRHSAGSAARREARANYNARYWLSDLDSFVFFIKAIPLPEHS